MKRIFVGHLSYSSNPLYHAPPKHASYRLQSRQSETPVAIAPTLSCKHEYHSNHSTRYREVHIEVEETAVRGSGGCARSLERVQGRKACAQVIERLDFLQSGADPLQLLITRVDRFTFGLKELCAQGQRNRHQRMDLEAD